MWRLLRVALTVGGSLLLIAGIVMIPAPPVAAVPGWSCPKCGNQNQLGDAVCSVCGTDRP